MNKAHELSQLKPTDLVVNFCGRDPDLCCLASAATKAKTSAGMAGRCWNCGGPIKLEMYKHQAGGKSPISSFGIRNPIFGKQNESNPSLVAAIVEPHTKNRFDELRKVKEIQEIKKTQLGSIVKFGSEEDFDPATAHYRPIGGGVLFVYASDAEDATKGESPDWWV